MSRSTLMLAVALTVMLCHLVSGQMVVNSTYTRDHPSRVDERMFRISQDKKDIIQYLNTRNVIKTMLKLLFGTTEESVATSRQVLNVFVKVSLPKPDLKQSSIFTLQTYLNT